MAKGLGAVAVLPLSGLYLALSSPRTFLTRRFYQAFLFGMALPALWFGSHYFLFREHFLREYVGHEIAYRVEHDVWAGFLSQKTTVRLGKAWGALLPLALSAPPLLFFIAFPGSSSPVFRVKRREVIFVYLAFLIPLMLANLVRQQMYWYVLPSIPPLAVLMALAIRAGMLSERIRDGGLSSPPSAPGFF